MTDANQTARMKRAKLLLQKFPQAASDFVFFMDKKCTRLLHLTIGRTVSGRQRELLKKRLSVFFSAGTARSADDWQPVNYASVAQLSEQLINTTMSSFSRKIRMSTSLLCTPSNSNILSISCPHR